MGGTENHTELTPIAIFKSHSYQREQNVRRYESPITDVSTSSTSTGPTILPSTLAPVLGTRGPASRFPVVILPVLSRTVNLSRTYIIAHPLMRSNHSSPFNPGRMSPSARANQETSPNLIGHFKAHQTLKQGSFFRESLLTDRIDRHAAAGSTFYARTTTSKNVFVMAKARRRNAGFAMMCNTYFVPTVLPKKKSIFFEALFVTLVNEQHARFNNGREDTTTAI
jgi:hypothetical protein